MWSLLNGFYDAYFGTEMTEVSAAGTIAPDVARMGGAAPMGQINEIWGSGRLIGNAEAMARGMGPGEMEMQPVGAGADVPELEVPLLEEAGPEAPELFMNDENDLLGELEDILGEPLEVTEYTEDLEGELYDAFDRFVEEPLDDADFFGDAWGEVEAGVEDVGEEATVILDGFGEVVEPLNPILEHAIADLVEEPLAALGPAALEEQLVRRELEWATEAADAAMEIAELGEEIMEEIDVAGEIGEGVGEGLLAGLRLGEIGVAIGEAAATAGLSILADWGGA